MNSNDYKYFVKGKLKLKGEDAAIKKKKSKKQKEKKAKEMAEKVVKEVLQKPADGEEAVAELLPPERRFTKCELAFRARQDKLLEEKLTKEGKITHKQRVEKFNKYLDSLPEYFDVPKVSWTK